MGSSFVRKEWEGPVPNRSPAISVIDNKKLRHRIQRAGMDHLHPVFRTEFQRTSRSLKFEDGGKATLDIDVGEISAGDKSEPICEFELELDTADSTQLFNLASEVRTAIPFRLTPMGKASRGYSLLADSGPQPQKHVKVELAADATVECVLTELIQNCLDHLQANELAVLHSDDAEGVHQVRVALRRLRAALWMFRPILPEDFYRQIADEAKWLSGEMASARTWDVFAEELLPPLMHLQSDKRILDAMAARVVQVRHESRERASDAILSERYTEFLLRLSALLSSRAWRNQHVSEKTIQLLDPIKDHSNDLLERRDRKVRKTGRRIEDLSESEIHNLRIAVKRLRYTADFLESLYPRRRVKQYLKRLSTLQDGLGYLNDVAEAEALVGKLTETDEISPETLNSACGIVIGWHSHATVAVKQELVRDMATFLDTKPYWRGS